MAKQVEHNTDLIQIVKDGISLGERRIFGKVMIRNAFAMLAAFSLLGCGVGANIEAYEKDQADQRARPSSIKWYALTDLEKAASYSIAEGIAQRCDSIELDQKQWTHVRPVRNRVVAFKGKRAFAGAILDARAAFKKKYGKPFFADLNHCDAGQTELRQQTAISFFLKQT